MRVTVLREIPEDAELRVAWNSLVQRMEHPEVFFTYEWAMAASRAFAKNLHPLLFLMHESDQLAGVVALAVDRNKPEAAFFLNASTADYCDVLSARENRKAVLTLVLQEIRNLGLRDLVLANLPSDSSTFTELPDAAKSCRFHLTSRAAYECAVIEFGDEQQRKDIMRAVVRKEREKRGLKKLATVGPVQVRHVCAPEQVEESLESIISTQVVRFLGTGRVSPLVYPERRAFLKELGGLLARAGWLKVSQLEINRQPIAWNYGFRFGDSWFWYLPTFQIQHEESSPGSCLLRLLVEEGCTDASLRWLDLGLGDESYKDRFGNALRKTCYVQLSRSLARHQSNVGRQILTRQVARFPRLRKKLLKARDSILLGRERIQKNSILETTGHVAQRIVGPLKSEDEILFFQAPDAHAPDTSPMYLAPLSWELVAKSAIDNADDMSMLRYLMRSTQRMSESAAQGLVLMDRAGVPLHYLWVTTFDGFHVSEINQSIEWGDPTAALIFDCMTPLGQRGHGYYPAAIRLIAARLGNEHRKPWIFCSANNAPSLHGILNSGFEYHFSLVRSMRLGSSTVTRRTTTSALPLLPR